MTERKLRFNAPMEITTSQPEEVDDQIGIDDEKEYDSLLRETRNTRNCFGREFRQ